MKALVQLKRFLSKIENKETIDLVAFKSLIADVIPDYPRQNTDIAARKVKGQQYLVVHIAAELLRTLKEIADFNISDRVSAATQNGSHRHRVNGSWLIVRERESHPQLVMFDQDGNFESPISVKKYAVLIENRENFLAITQTLAFLEKQCGIDASILEQSIAIFTDGNQVSNSLHRDYLVQFERLYLFLDVDPGGLQIASNLISLLLGKELSFVVPKDIRNRLLKVRKRQKAEEISKVINIGMKHSQLAHIAVLVRDTERIIEQESYLYDEQLQ